MRLLGLKQSLRRMFRSLEALTAIANRHSPSAAGHLRQASWHIARALEHLVN